MDSSNRESLPVSYIRQFCFCPRIPFLSVFLEIKPPPPLWVKDGVDFHEKAAMLQKRRKLSKFNLSGKGVFKFKHLFEELCLSDSWNRGRYFYHGGWRDYST